MIPNDKAMALARALDEKGGLDVTTLQLRGAFTDFFVIATGTSDRHVHTLADAVVEAVHKLGERPLGIEGGRGTRWTLVDLGDVVVHIFDHLAPLRRRLPPQLLAAVSYSSSG